MYRKLPIIIILIVLIAMLTVVFVLQPRLFKTSTKNIKIGYQPYWAGHINIMVAMKKLKLIEKRGYMPTYIQFLSGAPVNYALATGALDVGFAGDMPVISALASGMRVKIIANTAKSLKQAILIDKEKSNEIKYVKDLAGKRIAVAKGSCSHYFLYKILHLNGISPKNVNVIYMDVKDQPLALIANQIDAVSTWAPWITRIEKAGLGKILIDGGFSGYMYFNEDFMGKDQEAVEAFIAAVQEALEYVQKNFEQTCQWVAEETKEDFDTVYASAKTDRIFKAGETIALEPGLIEGLKEAAVFLKEQNLISNAPDFEKGIDLTWGKKVFKNDIRQ